MPSSSSARTRSAAWRATSVPRLPIATPMSARRSAGPSFTPSPVIATTSPRSWRAWMIVELLLGRGPGEHLRRGRPARLGQSSRQSTTLVAGADDAEVGGERAGGGRVVAGDEHRGDARRLAGRDGGRRGGPGRISDGDEAEQAQAVLQAARRRLGGAGRPTRRRAPGGRRWPARSARPRPARSRRRRSASTVGGEHRLWRALADDPDAAVRQPVHGGHPLAVAVERHLGDAGKPGVQVVRSAVRACRPRPAGPPRSGRRAPSRLFVAVRRPAGGVVAQRRRGQQRWPGPGASACGRAAARPWSRRRRAVAGRR